eukprot:2802258-Amphidinium_carterae.1
MLQLANGLGRSCRLSGVRFKVLVALEASLIAGLQIEWDFEDDAWGMEESSLDTRWPIKAQT